MQPLLKWAGGKRKLAPTLVPRLKAHLDRTGGTFIEPFFGSGAIFFALEPQKAIFSDALQPLIEMYETLKEAPRNFHAALERLVREGEGEAGYYRVRAMEPTSTAYRAARLLYLNKTGYNGLYRTNRQGKYNVPWGGPRNVTWPTLEELLVYHELLVRAQFAACDFRMTLVQAKPGDVIYADPPYDGTFTGYTGNGFDDKDQRELAAQLRYLATHGCRVFASNADTPNVREWYAWAKIESASETRAINRDGAGRGPAPTVLITYEE